LNGYFYQFYTDEYDSKSDKAVRHAKPYISVGDESVSIVLAGSGNPTMFLESEMFQMDRKIDDGLAANGQVFLIPDGSSSGCLDGADEYDLIITGDMSNCIFGFTIHQ